MKVRKEKPHFREPRVNTRISPEALERLNYACELREASEMLGIVTQGRIINELLLTHLEPRPKPEDESAPVRIASRKAAARARKADSARTVAVLKAAG